MPLVKLSTSLEYHLISLDEDGVERSEPDGTLQSETITRLLGAVVNGYTHVLLMSHGWKGDLPAARAQYDAWVGVAAEAWSRAATRNPSPTQFKPLIIGLHWPSLPWGDEASTGAVQGVLGANGVEVEEWAHRTAVTPAARAALGTIFAAMDRNLGAGPLPPDVDAAYATVAREAGLVADAREDVPKSGVLVFDPNATLVDAARLGVGSDVPADVPLTLGSGVRSSSAARELLLMPLRQLSFWKMKDRARRVGEGAVHDLLAAIRAANGKVGIHLMGHSFGCIVVSAAVAGAPENPRPPVAVDSLFLVQGALSLWSYAAAIPHRSGSGYFHTILTRNMVRGPIVTTRSTRDTAVGRIYPLGAQVARQYVLGGDEPLYGGIGAFGLQGVGAVDLPIGDADHIYRFARGRIYNIDASDVIRNGDGLSGAHSDIVHLEVANVMWEAVRATPPIPDVTPPDSFTPARADFGSASSAVRASLLGGVPKTPTSPRGATDWAGFALVLPQGLPQIEDAIAEDRAKEPSGTATAPRWINALLDGHPAGAPLVVARWYTLKVDVDIIAKAQAGAVSTVLSEPTFATGEEDIPLAVQVDSADFETAPAERMLILPRRGASPGAVRFGISPMHDGPCVLKMTLHRSNNFLQQITLTFQVGAETQPDVAITTTGRPLSAVQNTRARDIGLALTPLGDGYDCIAWGSVSGRATLPFSAAFLANTVDQFRKELTKVVMFTDSAGNPVFQVGIDIPEAAQVFALRTLARAGALLFNNLFYGPNSGPDSHKIGDYLARKLGEGGQALTLQVVTRGVPIPWACLYIGDASDGSVLSWDNFVGMRHVVEQIPMQPELIDASCDMPSNRPKLSVSMNVNASIDAAMNLKVVGDQRAYWDQVAARGKVSFRHRTSVAELVAALKNPDSEEQVIYFFCHATAVRPDEPGGLDAASLMLDGPITLQSLKIDAPIKRVLSSGPLIFINACESAELSPAFYEGFVPYFMSKGARGVIGTECVTPALFARHWAEGFFDAFLAGEPIGETFLRLRRKFVRDHDNPLGLLYAVHCDGDVRILPAPV